MPTPSGRPTADEKRAAKAVKVRAAQAKAAAEYDVANPGWSDAEAAALKAEADATPVNEGTYGFRPSVKREYPTEVQKWAVSEALDRIDVTWPGYTVATTMSFTLLSSAAPVHGVEVRAR